MTFIRIFTTTSAFALATGPAMADLTSEQVWADWKSLFDSYGAQISTSGEDASGDDLTISGLTATFDVQGGTMAMSLGDITFTEQGDGSVVVTVTDTMPVLMNVTNPDGKEGEVGFTISQPGGRVVASGDPGAMRYDFDYPIITMSDITITGEDVPENMPLEFDISLADMTGFITLAGDASQRDFESEALVGNFSMDMAFEDPESGNGTVRFSMTDLTQTVQGSLAEIGMEMSAAELIEAGMRQAGTGTYGPSTFEVSVDGPDGAFEMAAAAEGGTLDMTFDESGINYGGITNDVTVTVGGSSIPFPPLTFSMARSEGRFRMPVVPDPESAQDFGLVMTLEGLQIDNMLWGMFDPAGQLPRDPATVIVDLGGTAIVTEDFTAADYAEGAMTAPPGTLETLDVNRLQLSFAGAELTGDGDFAFDNEMGIPTPSGTANLMLKGGNGLLDTLVGMGLLPEDQAMGARMMLGLFARPGDGPDTLVSTIEVNEDGSILANGQRIK